MAEAVAHAEGQQHPIKLYLVVWSWLFVLSTFSYLVDYFHLQGYLRWGLILLFMAATEYLGRRRALGQSYLTAGLAEALRRRREP